jgi:hypothetical protein
MRDRANARFQRYPSAANKNPALPMLDSCFLHIENVISQVDAHADVRPVAKLDRRQSSLPRQCLVALRMGRFNEEARSSFPGDRRWPTVTVSLPSFF